MPSTSRSHSNDATWRPYPLRRTVMSMTPKRRWSGRPSRTSVASRIIPAQVPNTGSRRRGRPPAARRAPRTRGAATGSSTRRPGRTSPSSPSRSAGPAHRTRRRPERRPGPRRARGRRPAGRGRRWSPDRHPGRATLARSTSPGRPGGPRARRSPGPAWRRRGRWLTLATSSASSKWVVASTMARARAGRVGALEDPRAHEDGLGPELHHQGGVGRGGDAAGAEQRHRQAAGVGDLLDQADRCGQLLGPAVLLGRIGLGDAGGCRPGWSGGGGRPRRCCRCRPRPWSGSWPPPRRSAGAPRPGWWPRTRTGTAKRPLVDVVGLVGRGEHLALVDVVDAQRGSRIWASAKWPMRALAMTGMVTAAWMPSIRAGSLIRATPPSRRMSDGTRSRAMTATAPASSAIRAWSASTTSMITPPRSMSARPRLTVNVPVGRPLAVDADSVGASAMAPIVPPWPRGHVRAVAGGTSGGEARPVGTVSRRRRPRAWRWTPRRCRT